MFSIEKARQVPGMPAHDCCLTMRPGEIRGQLWKLFTSLKLCREKSESRNYTHQMTGCLLIFRLLQHYIASNWSLSKIKNKRKLFWGGGKCSFVYFSSNCFSIFFWFHKAEKRKGLQIWEKNRRGTNEFQMFPSQWKHSSLTLRQIFWFSFSHYECTPCVIGLGKCHNDVLSCADSMLTSDTPPAFWTSSSSRWSNNTGWDKASGAPRRAEIQTQQCRQDRLIYCWRLLTFLLLKEWEGNEPPPPPKKGTLTRYIAIWNDFSVIKENQ